MKLRAHQEKAKEIALKIVDGTRDDKFILAHVTPGGGKTLLASIFAHELITGNDVDHVLIVCPRESLCSQVASGFTNKDMGLPLGVQIKKVEQRALHDRAGSVVTIQAIQADPRRYLKLVSRDRWLVVIDESHHYPLNAIATEEAGWTRVVTPLVEKAKRVLLMTGTLARDDKAQLAFARYNEDRTPIVDVSYTRRDALAAQAILNVSVQLCDGEAKYWHRFSKHQHLLSKVGAAEESRARSTLLGDPDYRNAVLGKAIEDWTAHRDRHNPRARMIVVCDEVKNCRAVAGFIRSSFPKWKPVLAVSAEADARRALAAFRDKRDGDILITCQMAYEGLDVPDCTHLVCLTDIRSRPWLEQALSRVTRFDSLARLPWEEQCAFIFVPNDPSMVEFVSEWLEEQDGRYDDPSPPRTVVVAGRPHSSFNPESGEMRDVQYADTFGVFSEPDQKRITLARSEFPELQGIPTAHLLKVARRVWPSDDALVGRP